MLKHTFNNKDILEYPDFFIPSRGKMFSKLSKQEQDLLFEWAEEYVLPHLDKLPDYTACIIKVR